MKIQEMKSGILHLNKKVENERRENFFPVQPLTGTRYAPGQSHTPTSELEDARWSVVSFDQREAGGLNYVQAEKVMSEMDSLGVTGLCIVTDEAAERINVRQTAESVDQAERSFDVE